MIDIETLHNRISAAIIKELLPLCEKHGYGAAMQETERLWQKKAIDMGLPGSNFVVGPCEGLTTHCECQVAKDNEDDEEYERCEWCCGSGWVTKHVARLQARMSRRRM